MTATEAQYPPSPETGDDTITAMGVVNVILAQRRLILLVALATMVLVVGWMYLDTLEETYTASATIATQNAGSSQPNELARQLGLGVGGGGGGGESAQFYAALLKSRPFLVRAVDEPYRVEVDGQERTMTLVEWYGISNPDEHRARRSAASRLSRNVSTSVDRGTGFVTIQATAETPELAEQLAGTLVELVQEYNVAERRAGSAAEADFIAQRLEEARESYREAEERLARFLEQNRLFENSPELAFEHSRLQRELQFRQELVSSLMRSLEQTRMEQLRDIPLVRSVETAAGSASRDAPPNLIRLAVIGLFIGVVFGLVAAFVREFFQRNRERGGPDYQRFRSLRDETVAELKRPWALLTGGRA